MKAYTRFRVPVHIAQSLHDQAMAECSSLIPEHPSTFHVTLANFGEISPHAIPYLNTAIDCAFIRYAGKRPNLQIERFAVFKSAEKIRLVAIVTIDQFDHWNGCRGYMFKNIGIDVSASKFPVWNPHISVGFLPKSLGTQVPMKQKYSWAPDKLELVYKTDHLDLIIPSWRLD